MRKLWTCNDWSRFVDTTSRQGIRLRFDPKVHPEVRRALKEFVRWLRTYYVFPIRVPVYLKASETITTFTTRETASASFFAPYDKTVEPYIRIAVGDYEALCRERGQDNALAAILHSLAHELSHYYQWLKDYEWNPSKNEKQARYYAREIILDYAETREHP